MDKCLQIKPRYPLDSNLSGDSVINISNNPGPVTCSQHQRNKIIQLKIKAGIKVPDQLFLGFHIRVSAGDGVESDCVWSLWLREESMEYI